MTQPSPMSTFASSLGGAIGSTIFNGIGSAISGEINQNNQEQLMDKQYQQSRDFTRDQYKLMTQGMIEAGLNPATGLQSSPVQTAGGQASSQSGNITSRDLNIQAQQSAINSQNTQSQVNEAVANKTEAETNSIISKTPHEVQNLRNQNEVLRSQVALNQALQQNSLVDAKLKKAGINLTNLQVEEGKIRLGKELIDLQYASDENQIYNKVSDAISKAIGVDKSTAGTFARYAVKASEQVLGFLGKKNIAGSVGRNLSSTHYHNGDYYDVKTKAFSYSK